MNRLLLLLLLISGQLTAQQSENPILDIRASTNEVLVKRAKVQKAENIRLSKALLGKHFNPAKNNGDNIQDIVQIQSGKVLEVCVDTMDLASNFASLNDLDCTTLTSGSVSITDNCFSFTASAVLGVGRDTLCLELCDDGGNCTEVIYPIEVRDAVTLPFFEDWSNPRVITDESKWQDSDVYVNGTIGINPPTYGVATFDGIDKNGRPYGGGEDASDNLTSTYINMSSLSPASDVYFSYWVQPQGYGDRPEEQDSLVLEFRQVDGSWDRIESFQGVPADSTSSAQFPFTKRVIQLAENKYFFDGFQFRFTNYSSNKGSVDNWHVDYITMDQNSSSMANIDDVAFAALPEPVIKEYTSMPWRHFVAAPDLLRDSLTVAVSNLSDIVHDTEPRRYILLDGKDNSAVHIGDVFLDAMQSIIPANTTSIFSNPINNYTSYQNNVTSSFGTDDTVSLKIRLEIDPSFEQGQIIANNAVERTTEFANYFAYDDGSSETNIVAQNNGTQLAVEFDTYAEDSLRAISMSFINVTGLDITKELFNIRVYFDALETEPVLENILLKPILTNELFDTIQSFSTYALEDPATGEKQALYIPANQKFYIALQTASANPIPIGFDRNSLEAAGKNWLGLSGGWFPFPDSHQGAVLLRPVFGNETPATTSVSPDPIEQVSEIMEVYPNPTRGRLTFVSEGIPISSYHFTAYNTLGQIVQQGQLRDELDFSGNVDGVYYLKLVEKSTQKVYNHKFILSK